MGIMTCFTVGENEVVGFHVNRETRSFKKEPSLDIQGPYSHQFMEIRIVGLQPILVIL